jgi:hypothetical protein
LTLYRAAGWEIRIGRRPPEALFTQLGTRRATLLTAWNPRSRHMPEAWNRRMQQRLRECLRRFRVIEAEGTLAPWREAMLLVAGDPRPAVRLSVRFRQRAVVLLHRRQKVWLRLLDRVGCSGLPGPQWSLNGDAGTPVRQG